MQRAPCAARCGAPTASMAGGGVPRRSGGRVRVFRGCGDELNTGKCLPGQVFFPPSSLGVPLLCGLRACKGPHFHQGGLNDFKGIPAFPAPWYLPPFCFIAAL